MTNILDTGVKNVRNVQTYSIGNGSINDLPSVTKAHRIHSGNIIFFIDEFFSKSTTLLQKLQLHESDVVIYVSTKDEPSTKYIDEVVSKIKVDNNNL